MNVSNGDSKMKKLLLGAAALAAIRGSRFRGGHAGAHLYQGAGLYRAGGGL